MILLPIFLTLFTGIGILWIFRQYRFLNLFEQIALGFGVALSLFVFELTLQGLFFGKLSLLFPIITFIGVSGGLVYTQIKTQIFSEIRESIMTTFSLVGEQFSRMHIAKKLIGVMIVIYVLFKIFMAFSINVSMPTFDEDAVSGWDMKTKVFMENRSLVLDKTNPEFLGNALERNIFAPLTDVYFLLGYKEFPVGLSNIISPIIYLLSIFLLFGIFIRKTDTFFSILSLYIFTSLPFVFIHSFGSYFNYLFGFFLFLFLFYLLDQIFVKNTQNKNIVFLLACIGFLLAAVRNEGFMVALFSFIVLFGYYSFFIIGDGLKSFRKKENLLFLFPIVGLVLASFLGRYIISLYPKVVDMNFGSVEIGFGLIPKLFSALGDGQLVFAPLSQMFYHSDYNILYILFLITLFIIGFRWKTVGKSLEGMILIFFLLLSIFLTFLYITPGLGLLTHFAYVRYTLTLVLFIIFITLYVFYKISNPQSNTKKDI